MLRTAQSLPLEGLSTLGFDPARFQTEPPACYRATWQLPGPDSHRQATTSLRPKITYNRSPPVRWAHESAGLASSGEDLGPWVRPEGARASRVGVAWVVARTSVHDRVVRDHAMSRPPEAEEQSRIQLAAAV
jgi:hypothetical protein